MRFCLCDIEHKVKAVHFSFTAEEFSVTVQYRIMHAIGPWPVFMPQPAQLINYAVIIAKRGATIDVTPGAFLAYV